MKYLMTYINIIVVVVYFLLLLYLNWNQSGGDIILIGEFVLLLFVHIILICIVSIVILKNSKEILRGLTGLTIGCLISIITFNCIVNNKSAKIGSGETISIPLDSLNNKSDSLNK